MELNLLPTIQQAISSLLLTYEPEFLRFGHRLFLSLATIILAWHGIQMMFAREGLSDSMFEFAKLLLVVALGLLVHRVLRVAAARNRGVVQQSHHRPGVLLSVRARGEVVRQHLPAF